MADHIPNTDNKIPEVPMSETSLPALFRTFLTTLPQMIADERDLAGYSGQDPAVDAWVAAADASLSVTKSSCAAVLAAPATDVADRALRRVARVFHAVIESADPREVARLRRWAWLLPHDVPGHRRYNGMIGEALDAMETWIALDDVFDARAMSFADQGPDRDAGYDVVPFS